MPNVIRCLPLGPLETFVGANSDTELARHLDTDRFQIRRWRANGIPIHQADRLAIIRLGIHPMLIWLDAWLDIKPVNNP